MTKQEKVREGMSDILFRKGRGKWYKDEIINELLAFLHSQGVVVKVERELPKNPIKTASNYRRGFSQLYDAMADKYDQAQEDMAGYEAVESLI